LIYLIDLIAAGFLISDGGFLEFKIAVFDIRQLFF